MPRKPLYGELLTSRGPKLPDSWWGRMERVATHMNTTNNGDTPPVTMNFLFRMWIGKALDSYEAEHQLPVIKGKRK